MGTELTGTQKQIQEKEKNRRDRLSAFFYDLAKLVFAGTFIVNVPVILSLDVSLAAIANLLFGIIATALLAWIANRILTY